MNGGRLNRLHWRHTKAHHAGKLLAVVAVESQDEEQKRQFLHKGISERNFERKFHLGDHVKVTGANLEHGLLNIDLEREIPEEKKPRQIEIGSALLENKQ